MKRVLIFGGSFDPPHEGHRHLVESALSEMDFDRILIIPANIPPHKSRELTLSPEMRKAALQDLFRDLPRVEISDLELNREGKSYTIDTVREVQAEYPGHIVCLLMGTDMFLSFKSWFRFEELLAETVLIVGTRQANEYEKNAQFRDELLRSYACKGILLCRMEPLVMSSTYLRNINGGLSRRVFSYLGEHLDTARASHTLRVADYARSLAPRNGIDPDKAYLAGLLHDLTKCESTEWHIRYAEKNGFSLRREDLNCPKILHQFTGAIMAEKVFGVSDPDILNAVRYHSTGRAGMSPLEMLILFSDSCEPGRTYSGVSALRKKGEEDLEAGVLAYLAESIENIVKNGRTLHPLTVEAKEYLMRS